MQADNASLLNILGGVHEGASKGKGKVSSGDTVSLLMGDGKGGEGSEADFLALFKQLQSSPSMASPTKTDAPMNSQLQSALTELSKVDPEQAKKIEVALMNEGKLMNSTGKEVAELELLKGAKAKGLSPQMQVELLLAKNTAKTSDQAKTFAQIQNGKIVNESGANAKLEGGDDFLKNMAMLDRNRAVSISSDGRPEITQTSQHLSNYGKMQQNANNSVFNIGPKAFGATQTHSGERSAQVDDGMNLVQKSVDAELELMNKGQGGFQMESGLSRQLAPQATISTNQNTQVLDLGHIDASNKNELINKIMQGIERGNLERADSLDVLVKHNDLGNFRLSVNKVGVGQQIDLQIQAQTQEAQRFFSENEAELLKALEKSGVKVSEYKMMVSGGKEFAHFFVETKGTNTSSTSTSQDNQSSESKEGSANNKNGQSEDEAERQSQRRKALWDEFQQNFNEAA